MRNELNYIEQIEKYLEGTLTGDERASFEQKLSADKQLRESVDLQRAIVERVEILAFRDVVQRVHATHVGKGGFNAGWIIGALVLCAGLAYGGWQYMKKAEHENYVPEISHKTETVSEAVAQPVSAPTAISDSASAPVALDSVSDVTESSRKDDTRSFKAPVRPKYKLEHEEKKKTEEALSFGMEADISTDTLAISADKDTTIPELERTVVDLRNKNFVIPFSPWTFQAETGGTFKDDRSGTRITVPPGILMTADGKPVKGPVRLKYREYRDAADMAYCGIPMNFKRGDTTFNFNSAGMFELYVMKEADTLKIKPGGAVRVDFTVTQQVPGTSFYYLKREEGRWKEIGKIQVQEPVIDNKGKLKVSLKGSPEVREKESIAVRGKDTVAGLPVFFANPGRGGKFVPGDIDDAYMDAGHTYPNLVQGLACNEFGVYNCDQAYRMGKTVKVVPKFQDQYGKPIEHQNVMTLIDLNFNASFSFDPKYSFSINPDAKNVLFLFTHDNKVYAFSELDFKNSPVKSSGPRTFVMAEVTSTVKNTDDLRKYLGLVKQ